MLLLRMMMMSWFLQRYWNVFEGVESVCASESVPFRVQKQVKEKVRHQKCCDSDKASQLLGQKKKKKKKLKWK